ncbi:HFL059Cp [Eremothecium sinecaudum]|uniref:HFL059Cp n=1 Tax=Eremothecium sinecaudum TaxID=45286 RepID=A0A109UZT1_9SACH|nr:HFL059Cp [Eremothecium sinecaudum]AMD21797.1 HFL059Cp [Eremothecium sinecaudum]
MKNSHSDSQHSELPNHGVKIKPLKLCNNSVPTPDEHIQDYHDTTMPELFITEKILGLTKDVVSKHDAYLDCYIRLLNGYINTQRKAKTLVNERTCLIKYVKKLRFLERYLSSYEPDNSLIGDQLQRLVAQLASFFIRYLEIIDLLNYYLSQALKKEIIAKTLNTDLVLDSTCITIMDKTFLLYVKFVQWFVESCSPVVENDLTIEIIQFTKMCALDEPDEQDSDNILLQEVEFVTSSEEFEKHLVKWCDLLDQQCKEVRAAFDTNIEKFFQLTYKVKNSA